MDFFSVLEVQTDNIHIVHCRSCQKTQPHIKLLKSWFKLCSNVGGGTAGGDMQMNLRCSLDVFGYLCIISPCLSNGVRGLKESSDPIDFPVVG